jgi:hypothetical protein
MKKIILFGLILITFNINAQSAETIVGIKSPDRDTLYLDNSEVSTLITLIWEKPNIPYLKPVIVRITREELLMMLSRKKYETWITN